MRKLLPLLLIALLPISAQATTFVDFLKQTTVDGNIRSYYFVKEFQNASLPQQSSFSLGGQIHVLSGEWPTGLRAGATWYFAESLGLNNRDPKKTDNTLPGYNINVLGQTYLVYQNEYLLLKAGNQIINTPWINAADSRLIPITYQGIYSEFIPIKPLKITAMRILKFKDKTDTYFSKTNLYNPDGMSRSGIKRYGNTTNGGALAFGIQYKLSEFIIQGWHYKFYDLANLLYFNIDYEYPKNALIQPIFGIQYLKEWGDGNNLLKSYEGGIAHAEAYGVLMGAKYENLKITIGYNSVPSNQNSFHQGNILSPYTAGNDPLYTTSMIAGMVEKSPGQAIKLTTSYQSFNKRLQLSASYAKYFTAPYLQNTSETDFDVTYKFAGKFKDLSIRYRLGLLEGNSTTGQFIYNRLMLQYDF